MVQPKTFPVKVIDIDENHRGFDCNSQSAVRYKIPKVKREPIGGLEKSSKCRKFLVVHMGALGDFLLALPALESLHAASPAIRFDFFSKREHTSLLATKPYLGDTYPHDGLDLTPFFHEDLWRDAPLPAPFHGAEEVFVFGQELSRIVAERLSFRAGCPVHWIQSFPKEVRQPVTQFIVDQLRSLGLPAEDRLLRIDPPEKERHEAAEWLRSMGVSSDRPLALIHPGSGGRKKVWPLGNWWSLLHWIRREKGMRVGVTLGPADGFLTRFAAAAKKLGVFLLEEKSLPFLVAMLREARVYIGSDSGMSHLAAAVGTPSLVIFGTTDPQVWAPRGSNVRVFHTSWEDGQNLSWSEESLCTPLDLSILGELAALMDHASLQA